MKGLGVVYRKELGAMFNSPIAYVFLFVYLVISSFIYTEFFLFEHKLAEMRFFFEPVMPIILAIFLPAVTMRTWAEERRHGTIELLLTLPIRLPALVLAKFLACLTFFTVALIGSLTIPAVLILAWKADPGPIFSGYLGTFAVGAFFIATGMFVSAQTRDQIVAFLLSLVACFLFVILGFGFATNWIDGWIPGAGTFIRVNFGVGEHVDPFQKGVIQVSSLLHFAALTVMFLGLNVLSVAGLTNVRDRNRTALAGALVAGIGLLVSLNVNEARFGRLDVTENRSYTITDATRRILSKLRAPVHVTYYVTNVEKMPSRLKQLERDVTDFLREMAVVSPRFQYRVEDAAANESKARDAGLQPRPVQIMDKDQVQLARVYSAMTIGYLDKEPEKIEWIGPEELGHLEFEVVSRIHRLTLERKPKIAMVSATPDFQPWMRSFGQMPRDDYRDLTDMLRNQAYEVVKIKLDSKEPIPADADGLIVLEPENMNERQLWEINQFVRSGRPAVIAVQRYKVNYGSDLPMVTRLEPKIETLLKAWGVSVEDEILMDASFEVLQQRIGIFIEQLPYPMHAKITRDTMDSSSGILNGVGSLLYMWGAPVKLDQDGLSKAGLKARVLATTSHRSWTVPASTFTLFETHLTPERSDFKGKLPAYVWLEGTFPDAFAGKPVPAWPEGGGEAKPQEKPQPSKVLVTGSAYQFSNGLLDALGNGVFFMNALDMLTHGEGLSQIRSKQQKLRTIGSVSSGQALLYRALMWVGVPVLLVVAGLGRYAGRQRSRQAYQKAFAGE